MVFGTAHSRELRERSIDLLLGRMFVSLESDELESEVLFDDQLLVVSGNQSRWARSRRLKLADLVGEQWILPPAISVVGALNAEVFRACGLEMPHPSVTTLPIHLFLQLLITGRFVAMLPSSVLRLNRKNWPLKILPIKLPIQPKPVAIMRLKNRMLSPVAQVFIDCARAVAKTMPAKFSR